MGTPCGATASGTCCSARHSKLTAPCPAHPPCRQAERRDDIRDVLQHWGYARTIDMSPFEAEGQYFEAGCALV